MNLSHVRYFGFKNKGTGTDAAEHMYKILQQQSCQQSSRFLHPPAQPKVEGGGGKEAT